MPRLTLHLFGLPRAELDGRPVVTDRRKALALLIYLAVNGMDYTREALATLLWPDQDTHHVLAYLRRTLWEINQTFGPGWIRAERDLVGLSPDAREAIWIDVNHFRLLISQSRPRNDQPETIFLLEEAISLYQDDFLSGFYLKDASLYEEWMTSQAETLRHDYLFALETLARNYAKRGDLPKAIEKAAQWAKRDPLNETAHSFLMGLYAQNGQMSDALRQYQEYARVLALEMQMDPSPEMRAMLETIKKQAFQQPSPPPFDLKSLTTRFNLPESPYATSFFGRRVELAELEKLLKDPQTRLISIVGPGGVGKTRLALEVGRIQANWFTDGVCFVPLAAVARPEYIVSSIADALGVRFSSSEIRSQQEQLTEFLHPRHLLLILDNLEHLQLGSTVVSELIETLLHNAPYLKVLVTSHERLNLLQEWTFYVKGMPIPDADDANWSQFAAIQLFLQNVRKAAGVLHLTESERRAITRICRLVGGLPLGLELAATWTRMLSCQEIADEIERSLDFLKAPFRNIVERHQSLRATFEYSWNFLNQSEQETLMRLSVFRGGFKRDIAQSMFQADLATLVDLADKSFIHRDENGRFDIQQALKPFVAQKLQQHPDLEMSLTAHHASFYASFTAEQCRALRGHGQRAALDELNAELDNILAGWNWALAQGRSDIVLSFYEGLFRFFDLRNRFQDAEALFAHAVEQWQTVADEQDIVLGVLLACHAWFCNRLSHITRAHQLLLHSLTILRRLNARPHLMFVNGLALYVVPMVGDMNEIEQIAQETLNYYQEQDDRWGMAQILPFFHRIKTPQSLQEAIRLHNQTLDIYRETGDAAGLASALTSLGELLHYTGDYESALHCHQSSLEISSELNDRRVMAASLDYLGFINRQIGKFDEARQQHQQSMQLSHELGNALGIAGSLDNLGLIALDQGEASQALSLFQQALSLRRESGQIGSVATSLEHIATAALQLNNLSLAQTCLEEALELFAREPEWALTSRARNRLGDLERARHNLLAAEMHYRTAWREAQEHESVLVLLDSTLCLADLFAAQGNVRQAVQLAHYVAQHRACEFVMRQRALKLLDNLHALFAETDWSDLIHTKLTILSLQNILHN
ncbi:MAG: hypothetical protein DDG60_04810 [Anaerolineae bacterium]|nr:MAG: hypothetical protein DDG60_04810 [Anaerolineae bacterium]